MTEWWNLVESLTEWWNCTYSSKLVCLLVHWCEYTTLVYLHVQAHQPCFYTATISCQSNPIQSIDIDCQSNRKSINFIDYLSIIYRFINYLSIIYLSIVYVSIIINYRILIGPPLNRSKLWQTELNQLSSLDGIWYTPILTH